MGCLAFLGELKGYGACLEVVGGHESFWMPAFAGMTGSLPGCRQA